MPRRAVRPMIKLLCIVAIALGGIINPPSGWVANSSSERSMSAALLTAAGTTSTPNEDADSVIVRRNPGHAGCPASAMNMTRFVRGAISLSASSHFPDWIRDLNKYDRRALRHLLQL